MATRIAQQDARVGRFDDFASARGSAGAGDGEPTAPARVLKIDPGGGAIGGDALELQAGCADGRVLNVDGNACGGRGGAFCIGRGDRSSRRGAECPVCGRAQLSLPVKSIVAPVFELSSTPVPVSVIGPEAVRVPPVRFSTSSECAEEPEIAASSVMVPLPPLTSRPLPVVLVTATLESSVKAPTLLAAIPAPEVPVTVTPSRCPCSKLDAGAGAVCDRRVGAR